MASGMVSRTPLACGSPCEPQLYAAAVRRNENAPRNLSGHTRVSSGSVATNGSAIVPVDSINEGTYCCANNTSVLLQSNPFASVAKRRRTVSTPLRPLPSNWKSPFSPYRADGGWGNWSATGGNPPLDSAGTINGEGPLTGSRGDQKKRGSRVEAATPIEIRYPLVSFMLRHGYPSSLVQQAAEASVQSSADTYRQQMLLVVLEDMEDRLRGARGLQKILRAAAMRNQTELESVQRKSGHGEEGLEELVAHEALQAVVELRDQFITAALKEKHWPLTATSAAEALRRCLHSFCDSLRTKLTAAVETLQAGGGEILSSSLTVSKTWTRAQGGYPFNVYSGAKNEIRALADETIDDDLKTVQNRAKENQSEYSDYAISLSESVNKGSLIGHPLTPGKHSNGDDDSRKPSRFRGPSDGSVGGSSSPLPDETPLLMLLKREAACRRARSRLARTALASSAGGLTDLPTSIREQMQAKFAVMPGRLATIGEEEDDSPSPRAKDEVEPEQRRRHRHVGMYRRRTDSNQRIRAENVFVDEAHLEARSRRCCPSGIKRSHVLDSDSSDGDSGNSHDGGCSEEEEGDIVALGSTKPDDVPSQEASTQDTVRCHLPVEETCGAAAALQSVAGRPTRKRKLLACVSPEDVRPPDINEQPSCTRRSVALESRNLVAPPRARRCRGSTTGLDQQPLPQPQQSDVSGTTAIAVTRPTHHSSSRRCPNKQDGNCKDCQPSPPKAHTSSIEEFESDIDSEPCRRHKTESDDLTRSGAYHDSRTNAAPTVLEATLPQTAKTVACRTRRRQVRLRDGNEGPSRPANGGLDLKLSTKSTAPTKSACRRMTAPAGSSSTNTLPANGCQSPVNRPAVSKPNTRRRGTVGAGSLLGSKVAPVNRKRYNSRIAQTQKAKRTRETKWLRRQLDQQTRRLNEQMGAVARVDEAKLAALESVITSRPATAAAAAASVAALGTTEQCHVECYKEECGTQLLEAKENFGGDNGHAHHSTLCGELHMMHTKTAGDYGSAAGSRHLQPSQLALPSISDEWLKGILQGVFGLQSFRSGQLETLKRLLQQAKATIESKISNRVASAEEEKNRGDTPFLYQLLCLPTGAGKSLVYQMCAFVLAAHLHQLTVVIAPVVSLLDDQFSKLQTMMEGKLNVGRVHSSVEAAECKLTYQALRQGLVDVLFVTPEQFTSQRLWHAVASRRIGLLVVDEAHCLSEWSHSFRPAYQRVLVVSHKVFQIPTTLLVTATATRGTVVSMEATLKKLTGVDNTKIEIAGLDENYVHRDLEGTVSLIADERGSAGLDQLKNLLKLHDSKGTVLIYVWMKHVATRICQWLREWFPEFKVELFHSGLDIAVKSRAVHSLMNNKCDVLVATQALGVGIDSPWVRRVIHFNLPASLEQYVQEAGRCNRLGRFPSSPVDLILCPADFRTRHQQTSGSIVDRVAVSLGLQQILFTEPKPQVVAEKLRKRSHGTADNNGIVTLDVASCVRNKNNNLATGEKSCRQAAAAAAGYDGTGPRPIMFVSSTDDLRLITPEATPSRKRLPKYDIRLLQIPYKTLARLFNVRSDDDVAVILTVMEAAASELTAFEKPGARRELSPAIAAQEADPNGFHLANDPATLDGLASRWNSLVSWWHREHSEDGKALYASSADNTINRCIRANSKAKTGSQPSRGEGTVSVASASLATLQVWRTSAAGVELRAYDRPIPELAKKHPVLSFLAPVWCAGSGQVYKVYWTDVIARNGSMVGALVLDIDLLESMVYDAADELQLSVRPLSGFNKCAWFQVLSAAATDKWLTKAWRQVTDAVVNVLENNNRAQINRLCAAYIAFQLGKSSRKNMDAFTRQYFTWDPEMESLPTNKLWQRPELDWVTPLLASNTSLLGPVTSPSGASTEPGASRSKSPPALTSPSDPGSSYPPSNSTTDGGVSSGSASRGRGGSAAAKTAKSHSVITLLEQPFHGVADNLDLANFKADVRRLLNWFLSQSGKAVVSSDSARLTFDHEIVTPITIARVLCGISSAVYNTENAGIVPGWRSHIHTPFARVVEMAAKLIRKSHGQG